MQNITFIMLLCSNLNSRYIVEFNTSLTVGVFHSRAGKVLLGTRNENLKEQREDFALPKSTYCEIYYYLTKTDKNGTIDYKRTHSVYRHLYTSLFQ